MTLPSKLFHYSEHEIQNLNWDFYVNYDTWPDKAMKPKGFWLSVEEEDDHSWFDWCKDEQFKINHLRYKYAVKLIEDINILHLKTSKELKDFSREYMANDPLDIGAVSIIKRIDPYVYWIDWLRIRQEYDGIIISPYQWECRLAGLTSWYYSWDCSSGCIWDIDKISLELHSEIDIESLKEPGYQEEENLKDLLQVGQDLLT